MLKAIFADIICLVEFHYFTDVDRSQGSVIILQWNQHSSLTVLSYVLLLYAAECSGVTVAVRYPGTLDEFYQARLPGTFDESKAGKRMKLPIPETWETQVSLKGNKASTWQDLIGNLNHALSVFICG